MNIQIHPGKLHGHVDVIPSKSQGHRLLICAALSDNETQLICPDTNRDMEATASCLNALGANIESTCNGYLIRPMASIPQTASLNCCESGSTLRFLLPIVGALGVDAIFHMDGRLPQRPLSPLWEEMERMGCCLTRPTDTTIRCTGKLRAGDYSMVGNVSSQFITGLLLALSLIDGKSELHITGEVQSRPYIDMTYEAMALFGAPRYHSPGTVTVEGDWSNGAFWIGAQMLGSSLTVAGLNPSSRQGDRVITDICHQLKTGCCTISTADIPDLVPILSVVAAAQHGAVFTQIQRLRIKESDRVASVIAMINALGGSAKATEDTLTVDGTGLRGGIVDACNDHRIAMAAAIAATVCQDPVTVCGADAVKKSYPKFWEEYHRLGGSYEQYIR